MTVEQTEDAGAARVGLTIYGHQIDETILAEIEAVGLKVWIDTHPVAEQWRLEALAAAAERATYTVHDEPDFARTYDEDEMVEIRKGDLRALLDVATGSMDFGSGFLDNEQVEVLRKIGMMLGIDPLVVTPANFVCQYGGEHSWAWDKHVSVPNKTWPTLRPPTVGAWYCRRCRHVDTERPGPVAAESH